MATTIKKTANEEAETELENQSKYNFTRYLQKCYEENKVPDETLMNTVSFKEISKKRVLLYAEHNQRVERIDYEVEETLAQNCINNIPFGAYEKFVTADWINYTKNHQESLVGHIIYRRNIDLLERLHDLGLERALDKEKAKTDDGSSYAFNFLRDVLNPILSVTTNLKENHFNNHMSDDFAERYLKLVKKAVNEKDYFRQLHYFHTKEDAPVLKYTKKPEWVNHVEHNRYSDRNEIKEKNELMAALASDEKMYPLFEEALGQIMKKNKNLDNVKKILGLIAHNDKNEDKDNYPNILTTSFAHNNIKAANLIVQTFGLTEKNSLEAYENNLRVFLNNLNYNSDNQIHTFVKKYLNPNYAEMKEKFFPSMDTKYLPLFLLGTDEELKAKLLEKKDQIVDQPITVSDTLKDIICLAHTIKSYSEFLESSGKVLNWSDSRDANSKKTLDFFIAEYILKNNPHVLDMVDLKSASIEQWDKLSEKMDSLPTYCIWKNEQSEKGKINNGKLDYEELETWFKTFSLDTQLNVKAEAQTKKIKI